MQYRHPKASSPLRFFLSFNIVLSITVALLIFGLSMLLILHSYQFARLMRDNLEVEVFLEKDYSAQTRRKLTEYIQNQSYCRCQEQKPRFLSKEKAAQNFIKESKEDFTNFLGENPLRDVIIFKLASNYQQHNDIQRIKRTLEQKRGVYEVNYVENLLDIINHNTHRFLIVLGLLGAFAMLIVIILIDNTIRLALFSQRFLIRTMQLVGATARFIYRPFLKEALWRGILSALISNLLLALLLWYLAVQVPEIRLLYHLGYFTVLGVSLCLIGAGLATWCTRRTIKRYLNQSLDELY